MTSYTELQAEIKKLQQKAEQVRRDEIAGAIAKIIATMNEYGITVDQLGAAPRSKIVRKSRSPVAPKYRDPESGKTWSGRGKEPRWLGGKDRNQFLINK
ncbi:MAG: histone [Herminiimonas sp.]|jgi:DNA-binding protein H-NS|nr:histone [Herminiimonas sp.]MDB5854681.1 histone [Herminiimonas sp.]